MTPTAAKIHPRDERGQAIPELAIALPILALVLFGIIQFGIVFNRYLSLTDAARAGSRVAAVSRHEPDPVATATAAVEAAAPDLATGDLQVTVTPPPPWQTGDTVTVTASYPYEINVIGRVVGSGRLKTSIQERVE